MDDFGKVVEIRGDKAVVRIEKAERCKTCRACTFLPGESAVNIPAENAVGAETGDLVRVTADKPLLFKASALCYLMPLGLALLGVLIGYFFGEVGMIVGFFGGLIIGFLLLKIVDGVFSKKKEYQPRVAAIIKRADAPQEEKNGKSDE